MSAPRVNHHSRSVVAVLALAASATPTVAMTILFDNTNNGTASAAFVNYFYNNPAWETGLRFTVAAGYTLSISSVKLNLSGTGASFGITLWDPSVTTSLGRQIFTSSVVAGYSDYNLTDSVFSNLGPGEYRLSLGFVNSTELIEWRSSTATPSPAVSGLTIGAFNTSLDSGATWGGALQTPPQSKSMAR